jgi:hypothetical protein
MHKYKAKAFEGFVKKRIPCERGMFQTIHVLVYPYNILNSVHKYMWLQHKHASVDNVVEESCFNVQLLTIPRYDGSDKQEGPDIIMFGYMGIGFVIIHPLNLHMATSYKARLEAVKFAISIGFDSINPFTWNHLHERFVLH